MPPKNRKKTALTAPFSFQQPADLPDKKTTPNIADSGNEIEYISVKSEDGYGEQILSALMFYLISFLPVLLKKKIFKLVITKQKKMKMMMY
jgi:hypothetical protein